MLGLKGATSIMHVPGAKFTRTADMTCNLI